RFRAAGSQGMRDHRIAVLGGGAWGTALAVTMQRAGNSVRLWARDEEMVAASGRGEHPRYLPGIRLDSALEATTDRGAALGDADCVLVVTPAQVLTQVLGMAGPFVRKKIPLVLCAKGIESSTGRLPSEIANNILPQNPV